jgi:S-DNA-T family DNA segregation ATPase FtsK/SpoIIIE
LDRVRGNGGHAGRVALWVADDDPYARPPVRTPLLNVGHWDAWRPVPFGRDARDLRIDLPLVWTSLLVGAIPRQGKTMAARLAAASLIAHRFMAGDEATDTLTLNTWLTELVAEVQGRYRRMRNLDDLTCPESKITPELSRDPE